MKKDADAKKVNKVSKIVGIISTVFLVLCVGILLYSTISYAKTGLVKFFGYSYHVIQSHSMEPEIKVGDLVIVKEVPYSEINEEDDILFKCEDTNEDHKEVYGKYIVHRVREKTETEGVYITYGIRQNIDDRVPSKAEGKVVAVNSSLGGLFSFITQGKSIIFVVAIFGVVIFTIMQLCTVVANGALLKAEKDKQKVEDDQKLKEQIKKEVEEELAKNSQNIQENDENLVQNQQNIENPVENNAEKQNSIDAEKPSADDSSNTQTGGDSIWNFH